MVTPSETPTTSQFPFPFHMPGKQSNTQQILDYDVSQSLPNSFEYIPPKEVNEINVIIEQKKLELVRIDNEIEKRMEILQKLINSSQRMRKINGDLKRIYIEYNTLIKNLAEKS